MSICVRGQEGQSGPKTPLQSPDQGVIDRRSLQSGRWKRVGQCQVCRKRTGIESLRALKWRTRAHEEQIAANDCEIINNPIASPDHHLACGIGSERETKPWSKIVLVRL